MEKNRETGLARLDLNCMIPTLYQLIIEESMVCNLARVDLKCLIATNDLLVMEKNRQRSLD